MAVKKEVSASFQKGNFSCSLKNDIDKKESFLKKYAGIVNVDLNKLHAELTKAKKAYDKANPKKVD